ncbi:phosphotransferase [Streptomyces sp. HNM0574]|uniref:phosphotransferase enzyme family protein n=1 Tax=Streptomyces sp. HNM0574 TaxID=2714954 RepID=UPI00146EF737|nr:phosphotransferase [Streptomyces sp. HNM0574]NLU70517.1 phosphotransferase [Streptomyces sp. HNM0574]
MNPSREDRLPELLGPWQLTRPRVAAELTVLGDRSRVWRVETGDGPYVAKLTFDEPAYVAPGLRIASVLDRAGVPTGAPVPAPDGSLYRPVVRHRGRPWTLALHTFVPGAPLEPSDGAAAGEAGELLGRVHRLLTTLPEVPRPAGHLLDHYRGEARRLGRRRGAALRKALKALSRTTFTEGVLYGDPAPEILRGPGPLALIDWGTPSRGPLLHDVVSWQLFLTAGATPEDAPAAERRFLAAYREHCPLAERETAARGLFLDLHRAIQDAWTPEPPEDAAR